MENSLGHFLTVITNGANAGGAGAKPLLGSANTVQCTVKSGGAGEKPLLGSANTVQCQG